jgi:hypothetical protein
MAGEQKVRKSKGGFEGRMSAEKRGHDHSHAQEVQHDHSHDNAHVHDPGSGHAQAEGPIIKHSFLVPKKYPSRSSLRLQPLEELHPSLQKRFLEVIERHTKAHAEEFRGVTTNGNIVPELFHLGRTGITLQPLVEAAQKFLCTLTPAERAQVTFDLDAREWRMWHNGHAYHFRHGLCLHFMNDEKREAALGLMRESLSSSGFKHMRDIMRLNEHILEITGRPDEYGEWHYFISIFGEPSLEKPWGWQVDGHHLIINCLVIGDQMVMTPAFFGSEPVFAESGMYKGTRVLEQEEYRGYALMKALSADQQADATISQALPRQLFTIAPWDNRILEQKGTSFQDMSSLQKDMLVALVEIYTSRIRPGHAEIEMNTIKKHLNETKFAWAGPCDDVSPFYYRIHSPVVVIEFDHQSGVAFEGDEPARHHIHTLVRTPNGNDYGKDLLRQHHLKIDHSTAGPLQHQPRVASSG